jgi:hypothetical protein
LLGALWADEVRRYSSRALVLRSWSEHPSPGNIIAWTGESLLCWLREVSDLNDRLHVEQSAMVAGGVAESLKAWNISGEGVDIAGWMRLPLDLLAYNDKVLHWWVVHTAGWYVLLCCKGNKWDSASWIPIFRCVLSTSRYSEINLEEREQ